MGDLKLIVANLANPMQKPSAAYFHENECPGLQGRIVWNG